MKWLLVSPPKRGLAMFIESPPVGLGYLASVLRKHKQEVDLIDCIIEGWNKDKLMGYIKSTRPEVIGFNVFSTALQSVKEIIDEIRLDKEYTPMILIGGPHPTGSPQHAMNYFDGADFGFRGESEIPLIEFMEYLNGSRAITKVTGLIWRYEDGVAVANKPIEHPEIDDFGTPAWDLIDPRKYYDKINVGNKSINVHFSRGCPFSCSFCVKLGTKVRFHSWEHIWNEIETLHAKYGVERFIINDEGFTMFPEKVKEFCREAIKRGNKYRYFTATGMRLNRLDDEMLQLMKQANFETAFGVGIESAVPRVRQELMNKHLTQEELENGLQILKRNGFRPVGNFIIGFRGDTVSEIKESVRWACKAFDRGLLHGANFVPWLPLPGSQAVNEMIAHREISPDWDFSKLNLTMVVYAPKGMTIKELDKLRKWAVWKMNSRPKLLLHYLQPFAFKRAVVAFIRIYTPNWLLPKNWRRL